MRMLVSCPPKIVKKEEKGTVASHYKVQFGKFFGKLNQQSIYGTDSWASLNNRPDCSQPGAGAFL